MTPGSEVAEVNRPGLFKLVLEPESVGASVFVFETPSSRHCEKDWWLESLELAKEFCAEKYGVTHQQWRPA